MSLTKQFIKFSAIFVLIGSAAFSGFSQKKDAMSEGKRVMWEQVNISGRDLYWGPGGEQMKPVLAGSQNLGRQPGGNNIKYKLKDGSGRIWIAKMGRETKPETAAVRLLWGIGYKTEINYMVPKLSLTGIGNYSNVRFEARPEKIKRLDSWSWTDNPFKGTKEFDGLKIMMAMFNNWDLKDTNNVIFQEGDEYQYVISDLGTSFGKLAPVSGSKSGRSVNNPEQYAQTKLIKQARNGIIELAYSGQADYIIKDIKVEHGRWLADLLLQLSDKQIEDAFRAANYDDKDVKLLAQAFKSRINELDAATKSTSNAMTSN